MITTNTITLEFTGDGLAKQFDVQIEGIPVEPDGAAHFVVSTKDEDEEITVLRYGIDYSYTANVVNGFSQNITLTLTDALPDGVTLIVLRTTPIISISYYPDNKTPPRQVELDVDNIIKILQEHKHLLDWVLVELERKMDKDDPLPAHAPQHYEGAFDALPPEAIGAIRKAPATGKAYAATTTTGGTPGWVEITGPVGVGVAASVVVETSYFTCDGVSADYGVSVVHDLSTNYVNAVVYDNVTNKQVHFGVTVPDANTVIFHSKVVQPAGRTFRALIYGPGKIDPAWLKSRYDHTQATPAVTWTINHKLKNRFPLVIVFDAAGNEIACKKDFATSTMDTLTLTMSEAVAGTAVLYGWNEGERTSLASAAYAHKQAFASNKWVIHHSLGDDRPTVLVLDDAGGVLLPTPDYAGASPADITLRFSEAVTGTAYIGVR